MTIGFALLLLAAGTQDQTTSQPGDDKIVCEQQEETGSRLAARRICMTRAQWRDEAFKNRMEVQGRQHRWDNGG